MFFNELMFFKGFFFQLVQEDKLQVVDVLYLFEFKDNMKDFSLKFFV